MRCEEDCAGRFLEEYEVQYLCKSGVGAQKYSSVRVHAAATGELRTQVRSKAGWLAGIPT